MVWLRESGNGCNPSYIGIPRSHNWSACAAFSVCYHLTAIGSLFVPVRILTWVRWQMISHESSFVRVDQDYGLQIKPAREADYLGPDLNVMMSSSNLICKTRIT